jgi:hypothetical protein
MHTASLVLQTVHEDMITHADRRLVRTDYHLELATMLSAKLQKYIYIVS